MSGISIDGLLAENQALRDSNIVGQKDASLFNKANDQTKAVVGTLLEGVDGTANAIQGRGERINTVA